jgi:hypothetical protein
MSVVSEVTEWISHCRALDVDRLSFHYSDNPTQQRHMSVLATNTDK